MEQANKIALDQEELGQQISKLYVNLKKDSAARKTGEYLETKTAILEDCWTEIEDNNDKIIEKDYESGKMYIEECQEKINCELPASMLDEIKEFRQLVEKISEEITQEKCKIQYKILQDRLKREWEIVNKESERKNASARSIQNCIGDLYDQIREELLTKIDQLEEKGTYLDIPALRDRSANKLKKLHDKTNECLQQVRNMESLIGNKSVPIDIILSAKEDDESLVDEICESTKEPYVQNTKFWELEEIFVPLFARNTEPDWILCGPINDNSTGTFSEKSMITETEEDQQNTKIWELEEISVPRKLTEAEEVCEEYVEETERKEEETYVVQIPFKQETTSFGDLRNRPISRLMQLEKRFTKNEEQKIAHNQVMQEYIDLGHMSRMCRDNGTTFIGAHKHLNREVRLIETNQEVQDYLVTNGTQWHFIPPSAPHFGGLWEAGVKSMKHHMKRIIGDATLTYEELTTLMHQIEACLNSRPLTALTDNTDDIQALTPGHFLIGRELVTPPDPIDTPINSNISSRWRLVQKLKKDLWKAWSSEYLSRLQQRYKWKTPEHNAQIGDLVLIKEDIKPSRWPLARVTEVHPGKDGAVRVISMKKADGTTVKRAIHKTIPLPVNSDVTVGAENNTPQKVNSNSATTRKSQITEMRNKKTDLFLQDKVNSTRY